MSQCSIQCQQPMSSNRQRKTVLCPALACSARRISCCGSPKTCLGHLHIRQPKQQVLQLGGLKIAESPCRQIILCLCQHTPVSAEEACLCTISCRMDTEN